MSHLFLQGKLHSEKKQWTEEYYIAQMNVDYSNTCTGTVCSLTIKKSDQKKGKEKYGIKIVKKYLSLITEEE